nr:FMN-binding protein [uncultured Marinifilum sp.]
MKRLVIILMILLCGLNSTLALSFPKSIQKRIDKAVKATFSHNDIVLDNVQELGLDAFKYQDVRNVSLGTVTLMGKIKGFACFASSKGKSDYFDYMVLFNEDLEIQKVVVLVYRSSYGGEIMAKYWLKQFIGKVKGENMEFGKDIDGISGATISAPSITKGIKMLSLILNDLKVNGAI